MADDEKDEVFESQDAGASDRYPIEAGQIRKGGFIMIKDRPCKVSDVSTSKTGKHGHAKCHFVAIDIFNGKKVEDLVPASHTTYAPFVKKMEFQCMDVDDDGFLSVMGVQQHCMCLVCRSACCLPTCYITATARTAPCAAARRSFFTALSSPLCP